MNQFDKIKAYVISNQDIQQELISSHKTKKYTEEANDILVLTLMHEIKETINQPVDISKFIEKRGLELAKGMSKFIMEPSERIPGVITDKKQDPSILPISVESKPMSDLKNTIFVFGSNEAGRHGAGAARYAMEHRGAIYGKGVGLMGTSYALPTKGEAHNRALFTLRLSKIQEYVDQFLSFAQEHKDMRFQVTRIGCGLAGLKDTEMAPMFANAPSNVLLPGVWKAILNPEFRLLAVLSPNGPIPSGEHIVMYAGDIRVPHGAYKSTTVDHSDFENLAWYASHYAPTDNERVKKMMEDRGVICYTGPTIVCDKDPRPC